MLVTIGEVLVLSIIAASLAFLFVFLYYGVLKYDKDEYQPMWKDFTCDRLNQIVKELDSEIRKFKRQKKGKSLKKEQKDNLQGNIDECLKLKYSIKDELDSRG